MSEHAAEHEGTAQLSDLITEIETIEGVCFDPKELTLHGLYADELSAHRARRGWIEILDSNFFLDDDVDVKLKVRGDTERGRFILTCEFMSASARYAFWRLTHQQSPEAQYLIETAHIPNSEFSNELSRAPDLSPLVDDISDLDDPFHIASCVENQSVLLKILGQFATHCAAKRKRSF